VLLRFSTKCRPGLIWLLGRRSVKDIARHELPALRHRLINRDSQRKMNEPRLTVFDGEGNGYENVFLALGFSPEEAAQMMAESAKRIALRERRDRLFTAVAGKRKKAGKRRRFPS